jgi:hypothetical protein
MTVIAFQPKADGEANGWTAEERNQFEALLAARANCGEASECVIETTETGDPQFFLLGPTPACECVLSISRVSGRYVMEDGAGALLGESAIFDEVMEAASHVRLRRTRTNLVARIVAAWVAFREFVEEKTEPVAAEVAEVAEVLTHVMPQVAAFA